ncbi:MAG: hypothetical protein LM556_01255 [Desulfurococcaceae archaeon]|jgi:hypothetical protein|nr:hypothetical protein [Desulfurococcaceae archaeon]
MPIRYICRSCGHVIYEFKKVGQDFTGVPTPLEVIRITGGICPACKRHLELPSPEEYRSYIILKPHVSRSTKYSELLIPVTRGAQISEAKA